MDNLVKVYSIIKYICQKNGRCGISNKKIGDEVGITLRRVQIHLRELEELGLVRKEFLNPRCRFLYLTDKENEILSNK